MRQHLDRALTLPVGGASGRGADANHFDILAVLVDTAAQQRDLPALLAYLPRAEAEAAAIEHRLYQAIARRARGVAEALAGNLAAAQAHLRAALTEFQALGTAWQAGRACFELGAVAQQRAGSLTPEARAHYAQARAYFEQLQALPDLERVQAVLA